MNKIIANIPAFALLGAGVYLLLKGHPVAGGFLLVACTFAMRA